MRHPVIAFHRRSRRIFRRSSKRGARLRDPGPAGEADVENADLPEAATVLFRRIYAAIDPIGITYGRNDLSTMVWVIKHGRIKDRIYLKFE